MTQHTTPTGLLVISRHGESEWNLLGKWTGQTDVSITEKGAADSRKVGELLRGYKFDAVYTSDLRRTIETLVAHLDTMEHEGEIPHTTHPALKERDYGELTGMDKWEVKQKVGEAKFNGIRRSWDHPVPGGETLKDVHDRTIPYFDTEILPQLHEGKNVLMVSHGNTIRALMKHLEEIHEDDMAEVEMPFGTVLIYHFAPGVAKPHKKEVLQANITPPHA
jgi:2,3-bisphosphoglycerate-dependent phosphoglycerate mutase